MSLALRGRMNVLRRATARLVGSASVFEPLPEGVPIRPIKTEEVQPALFVTEQINRVTHCAFGSTVEAQVAKLKATEVVSSPPVAIQFSAATVFGGQVLSNGKRYLMSKKSPYRDALGPVLDFRDIVLPQSYTGCTVFGHWLTDDCAARELPEAQGQSIAISRPKWADSIHYERLFEQTWTDVPAFTAQRLTLLKELGFSKDKADRHKRLRERVRQSLKPGPGGVVYLARGKTGNVRNMVNEEELTTRLAAMGVTIIECEADGEALIQRCLDAQVILGIEGSQLSHAIYLLAEGGGVVALQPPDRFCNAHHDWSRQLGMHYGTVIGKHVEGGWSADPDEVLAMIDMLINAIS